MEGLPEQDSSAANGLATREIPEEVADRHAAWLRNWRVSVGMHYVFGIVGVGASAIAAAVDNSQVFSIIAAISIAVIGFIQPERRYLKFVGAWRRLDAAVLRYRYGRAELDDLLDAVKDGESILTEVEQEKVRTADGS